MRLSILLLTALLALGCSSKQTHQNDPEVITRFGVITARETVDRDQVEKDSKVKTSVFASVSSGGGVSIGLGFLLSPFFSDETEEDLIRYEVELKDGSQVTVYHASHDFEVDDCVEITSSADDESAPVVMKRNKGAC